MMDDSMTKAMAQAASFQKLWMDSFSNMAGVWSQYSPSSPPPEELRRMRSGMLKVLAESWDEFMRTPLFMEMMKTSMNAALDLRKMGQDGASKVHEAFGTAAKEDIDGILMAIRHVERRVLDRFEVVDEKLGALEESLGEVDKQIGKFERRLSTVEDASAGKETAPAARKSPTRKPARKGTRT